MEAIPEQQALDFPTKPLSILRPGLLYGEVPSRYGATQVWSLPAAIYS
jgi:hypothetical protein